MLKGWIGLHGSASGDQVCFTWLRLRFEDGVDGDLQFFEIHGFGKKLLRAGDLGGVARDVGAHSADHDDGDIQRGRVASEDFADAEAVKVRQEQIQEDEIRRIIPGGVEGVGAVGGGVEAVAAVGQAVLDEFGEVEFVVDEENSFLHGGGIAAGAGMAMSRR